MKILKYLFIALAFTFYSCEEIVTLDLETAKSRLVVDAAITWEIGTTGNNQQIQLTNTTGFYSEHAPVVNNAIVTITNIQTNEVFIFTEDENTGIYICNNFVPNIDNEYLLIIENEGQVYTAREKLTKGVAIDKIEQKEDGGFMRNQYEINVFYTDIDNQDNFYLIKYLPDYAVVPTFSTSEDTFYQGNQFNGIFSSEDLQIGTNTEITLYGISKQYYNYMNILDSVLGSGNPFGSAPATVKGNVINETDIENFAYGYFSLSQTTSTVYIIN